MIKTAKEIIATGDVGRVVDFTIEAMRFVMSTQREVEVAKTFLRECAADIVAHTNRPDATLRGTLGTATVLFQRPSPRARKGVDLLAAEATMPAELFSLFFRKRTVVDIVDDAEEKLAALPVSQRNVIANLIEIEAPTPRVTVK